MWPAHRSNASRARLAQSAGPGGPGDEAKRRPDLRLAQQRAALVRARDQFGKTTITSPLEGVITYLPVNEGEIAIVGVQNQPGTILMTIADMSVITAEVRVDETDIVNVKLGQEAQIRVDALGDERPAGPRLRGRQQRADARQAARDTRREHSGGEGLQGRHHTRQAAAGIAPRALRARRRSLPQPASRC